MFFGRLAFVFEVMIYVGLGLPLINLLLGLISGGGSASDVGGSADMGSPEAPDFASDLSAEMDMATDMDMASDMDVEGIKGIKSEGSTGEYAGNSVHKGFLIRFDIYCLCLSLVVMGAVGVFGTINYSGIALILILAVGLCLALTSYYLVYRFIMLPLKKNKGDALKAQSLQYQHAIVIFRITKDSPGKIQTKDGVGATISFMAKLDPDISKEERIEELEEVVITDIDKEQNLCYVVPAKNKYIK